MTKNSLQQRGECCGLEVWVDGYNLHYQNFQCGHGAWPEKTCAKKLLELALATIPENLADLEFDEWGEAHFPINEEIEIRVDRGDPVKYFAIT